MSVVTIGELQLGVLHPADDSSRARRADTLALARTADPIPISEAVMVAWARLVTDCRAASVQRTIKLTDALIAATAVEHGFLSSHRTMTTTSSHPHTPPYRSSRSNTRSSPRLAS